MDTISPLDNDTTSFHDVLVVGGGPAGLSAALVLGRACRNVAVIDSGRQRNAPAISMHGFLSRDGIEPQTFLEEARRDLAQYKVRLFADRVSYAERVARRQHPYETGFLVRGQSGRTWLGRKLLIATGMRDKLPDFSGVQECYGATVHHCPYCDGWERRGQRLFAYGDTPDQAAGLGLMLRGWTDRVTVLTHGGRLKLEYREQLRTLGIAWHEEPIRRLVHQGRTLHGVELEGCGIIPADALFFNTQELPHSPLAECLGVILDKSGISQTNRRQKTNVPGIYMAGDAAGNIQMVIVAAGEGATAAVAMNRELQEEDRQLGQGYPDATSSAHEQWLQARNAPAPAERKRA